MRYTLISDVHANLPALSAVLDHARVQRGSAAIYHLGDLVGYAPWPNECVALLRSAGVPGIAGNYDSTVALDHKHCGCSYEDPEQEALAHRSYAWTRQNCSDDTKTFLASLPFRIDLRPLGGHQSGPRVVLVHGTPTLNTLYWTEERDDAFCLKMAEHADLVAGDVICFGHTHKPWHREIGGMHFINAGSVGRPKDGDPRAAYVLLELSGRDVCVEHVRVEYDVDAAVQGIRDSGLPHEFADHLVTGGKAVDGRRG